MGTIMSQYNHIDKYIYNRRIEKDPYEAISILECHKGFVAVAHMSLCCIVCNQIFNFKIFIFSIGHKIDMDPSFFVKLQTNHPGKRSHIPIPRTFKDDFPFPQVGYVNSPEGNHPWILHVGYRHSWQPDVIRILQVGMLGDWWRLPWVERSLKGVITTGIPRKRAPDSWGIFWSYSFLDVFVWIFGITAAKPIGCLSVWGWRLC